MPSLCCFRVSSSPVHCPKYSFAHFFHPSPQKSPFQSSLTPPFNSELAYISSSTTTPLLGCQHHFHYSWKGTLSNSTGIGSFYIDPSSSISAVRFASSTTGTMTGFTLFGGQVVYINNDQHKSHFWAQTTREDRTWGLYWNTDRRTQGNTVPVVVKALRPLTISS